ncbi:MAG: retention module-containing protein, partial [Gammaproteobacteria bacterium]|nr:retention module-containing protein [Gammaproteobacteria bacterium]
MALAVIALVQSVKNAVYAVAADGHRRLLKAGDALYAGETVQTGRDGEVVLAPEGGKPFLLGSGKELLVDANLLGGEIAADEGSVLGDANAEAVLAALREGRDLSTDLEATAAGLGGGGANAGHDFVRLLRIAETLSGGVVSERAEGGEADFEFLGGNDAEANTAPTANPDAVTTDEDTPLTINVLGNDTDPEGDPLSVVSAAVTSGEGTVTINPDGTLSFVPAPNTSGTVVITYTITDGQGGSSTSTVTITVVAVDDPSIVQPDAQIIDEDTVATGNVLGNDSDIDSTLSVVSFTINGQSYTAGQTAVLDGIGTLVINADGTYSFTPAANWNGVMPQAVYTLNTGSSTTLDITVRPVDDASAVQPDSQIIDEDTVATGNVLANDSDIDSTLSVVSFTIDGQSYTAGQTAVLDGIGSLVINADGSYVFTPAANWNGVMPQAVYTLNTGSSTTLDITVRPVDDASAVQP